MDSFPFSSFSPQPHQFELSSKTFPLFHVSVLVLFSSIVSFHLHSPFRTTASVRLLITPHPLFLVSQTRPRHQHSTTDGLTYRPPYRYDTGLIPVRHFAIARTPEWILPPSPHHSPRHRLSPPFTISSIPPSPSCPLVPSPSRLSTGHNTGVIHRSVHPPGHRADLRASPSSPSPSTVSTPVGPVRYPGPGPGPGPGR